MPASTKRYWSKEITYVTGTLGSQNSSRIATLALASILRHASGRVSGSQTLLRTAIGCLKAGAKDDKVKNCLFMCPFYEESSSCFLLLFVVIFLSMDLSDHNVYQVPVREGAAHVKKNTERWSQKLVSI